MRRKRKRKKKTPQSLATPAASIGSVGLVDLSTVYPIGQLDSTSYLEICNADQIGDGESSHG